MPAAAATNADSRDTALVLFSGGQDSATCLAWALDRFAHVETIGFDYGQRHIVELACREEFIAALRERYPQWSVRLGDDHVLDLRLLKALGKSALTGDSEIAMGANGLPTTFVPGPQPPVPDRRRGAGVSPRLAGAGRRHVRDRLLRLPGLPR